MKFIPAIELRVYDPEIQQTTTGLREPIQSVRNVGERRTTDTVTLVGIATSSLFNYSIARLRSNLGSFQRFQLSFVSFISFNATFSLLNTNNSGEMLKIRIQTYVFTRMYVHAIDATPAAPRLRDGENRVFIRLVFNYQK